MCKSLFLRGSWLLMGTAIVLLAPSFGRAQGQLAAKDDLIKAYDASDKSDKLRALFSGERQASKADEKHAVVAAQWFLYRITIKNYYPAPKTETAPTSAEKLQKEFLDKVVDFMDHRRAPENAGKKEEFRKMFAAALVSSMKDVLARDVKADPTTVVQAAEMLSTMAKLKHDGVNNYLCELAKDGKNPVVQLNALKALKEAMPIPEQPDPENVSVNFDAFLKNKSRDVKNVDAMRQFIEQPVNTKGMTLEEYRAVIFIRREAITSLAQAKAPAVYAIPNKKQPLPPEGAAAHTLLRVLSGDLQPPPTLQEKVEASLGLCYMKYPNMPDYEPQVAVYLIGRTLEEFVMEYQKDWVNFSAVGGAAKKHPQVPFIVDSRLLKAGLKELVANTPKDTPAAKAARDLEAAASGPILDTITGTLTKPDSKYGPVQPQRVNDLNAVVKQARPKNGYVFKNMKMPEIQLGK